MRSLARFAITSWNLHYINIYCTLFIIKTENILNKLLSKTMTLFKNREFKHDVYCTADSERQRLLLTLCAFLLILNYISYTKIEKCLLLFTATNYKYFHSTVYTSENRQQKFHVILNHSNHIFLPKYYTNTK